MVVEVVVGSVKLRAYCCRLATPLATVAFSCGWAAAAAGKESTGAGSRFTVSLSNR
jgi:hypothetical protein